MRKNGKDKIKLKLKVKKFDKRFTDRYVESEHLVALQNSVISKLSGWKDNDDISEETLNLLVKVTNKEKDRGKSIYRRAVGYTVKDFIAGDIMLGYRSMKQLNVKEDSYIEIESARWYCYLWYHAEASIRCSFRFAVIVAIVSIVLSVIGLFI